MLTRLEISGFKSFTDFEVDFAPLTVIAGANASGKSNLIEALRLVKGLAQKGSFGEGLSHQGNIKDLFTKFDGKNSASVISLGVEFNISRNHLQGLGDGLITRTKLRYDIEITHHSDNIRGEWFEITEERLFTNDQDARFYFINQKSGDKRGKVNGKHPESNIFTTMEWTTLSEASFGEDSHVFASKRALGGLILTDLIAPSNFSDYERSKDSSVQKDPNDILPSLVRLKKAGMGHLHYLSQRVRQVVSDIATVDVYTDDYDRSTVTATDTEGRSFLPTNLSEGTLRIIALASYLLKRKTEQVLLIEEPENGIDPRRATEMLSLLVDLSSNHGTGDGEQWQVICTTHSPTLLQAVLNLDDQEKVVVLLSNKVGYLRTVNGQRRKLKVTRMNPVLRKTDAKGDATPLELYTLREAMEYLAPINREEITEDA